AQPMMRSVSALISSSFSFSVFIDNPSYTMNSRSSLFLSYLSSSVFICGKISVNAHPLAKALPQSRDARCADVIVERLQFGQVFQVGRGGQSLGACIANAVRDEDQRREIGQVRGSGQGRDAGIADAIAAQVQGSQVGQIGGIGQGLDAL